MDDLRFRGRPAINFTLYEIKLGTLSLRIAHGLHDLTLADLRHYFNPNANKTNNIPTVNR